MPVGFADAGVDFDDLFDPDIVGDGPTAPALTLNGTPLKYAAIVYGSKRPDVGYAQNGVDVSNLWAAKGTAVYVSDGGLPAGVEATSATPVGVPSSATANIVYAPSGVASWSSEEIGNTGSGQWTSEPGSNFDIRFDVLSSAGVSPPVGTFGAWLQVNAARSVGLTTVGVPYRVSSATIRLQIRRRSTGQVLVDRTVFMSAAVEEGV